MKKLLFISFILLSISMTACTGGTSKVSYDDSFSFSESSEKEPDTPKYYFLTDVYYDDNIFAKFSYSEDFKTVKHYISQGDVETLYFNDEYVLIKETHVIEEFSIDETDLFEYDTNGNLTKKTSYVGEEIDEITTYEYENNVLVKETTYDSFYGLDNKYSEIVYEYEDNVYREKNYFLNDEDSLYLEYVNEYITLNKNEDTYTIEYYQIDFEDGENRELCSTSVYDTKTNNLVDYCSEVYYEHYEYNEYGYKTYYELGDIIDFVKVPVVKYVINYDNNNFISSYECYENLEGTECFGLKAEIICNDKGVVTDIVEYKINESSQWEKSTSLSYKFVECDIYIPYLIENLMYCAYYPGNYNII